MKLRYMLVLLIAVATTSLQAQELVGTASGKLSNNTMQVEWSIGELSTATISGNGYFVTSGLYQEYSAVSGINELQSQLQLQIYPNPTLGEPNLELGNLKEDVNLSVITLSGQVVKQQALVAGENVFRLDLKNLPTGTYMVLIYASTGELLGHTRIVKL